MYQVIKRDGHVAEFSLNRISSAIMKAFDATHIPYAPDVIDLLSLQVTADYADKIRDGRIDVETIQDSVEAVLQRAGYAEVAKAYILYRKNRFSGSYFADQRNLCNLTLGCGVFRCNSLDCTKAAGMESFIADFNGSRFCCISFDIAFPLQCFQMCMYRGCRTKGNRFADLTHRRRESSLQNFLF